MAGALLMVVAFAIGRATSSGEAASTTTVAAVATSDVPETTATSTVTTTAPTTAPTTIRVATTTTTTAPATTTTTTLTSLDPVAEVAASVGPAVVQIEAGFGLGSGVIYDDLGHILTAAHVLNGQVGTVTVRLSDGRVLDGEVIGAHEPTDIAVVRVDSPDLPVARLAVGEDLRIGQLAVALGSPFGFDQSVTAGIVSNIDRLIGGISMVQTDAAINPGNSGGPLLDRSGAVIGINDVIFTRSGVNEGVGFAISIDLAWVVAEQIVAGDAVRLGFLGVFVSDETGDVPGALLDRVQIGTPAFDGGLRAGDIVVSFDGEPVPNSDALGAKVMRSLPGRTVSIGVHRDGTVTDVTVTLGDTIS